MQYLCLMFQKIQSGTLRKIFDISSKKNYLKFEHHSFYQHNLLQKILRINLLQTLQANYSNILDLTLKNAIKARKKFPCANPTDEIKYFQVIIN